jgi:hypothetical protein
MYNPFRDYFHVLVFPNTNHCPTLGFQSLVRIVVALAIAQYLLSPPFGIRLWPSPMNWTPVPKAAIQENSYAPRGECNIRRPLQALQQFQMHPET